MLAPPSTMPDAQHQLWVVPSNFKDARQHLLREEKARLKGEDSLYKIIGQLSSHLLEKCGRQGKTGYQHRWHCNHLHNRETWQTRKDGGPWQMMLSKENHSWSMSFEPRSLAIKVVITTVWVGSKDSNASELIFWLPVGWLAHLFVHTKRFEEIRNQALKKILPSCLYSFFNLVIPPELLNGTAYYEINRLGPDSHWAGCPPTLWYRAFPGLSECGRRWLLISGKEGNGTHSCLSVAWGLVTVRTPLTSLANGSTAVSEPSVTERPNQRVESNSKTSHILEYVPLSALIFQKQPGTWVSAAIKLLAVISWGVWLSFVRDFLPSFSRWLNWLQRILLGSTQLFSHNPAVISMN